jgi:hypothetical protein
MPRHGFAGRRRPIAPASSPTKAMRCVRALTRYSDSASTAECRRRRAGPNSETILAEHRGTMVLSRAQL